MNIKNALGVNVTVTQTLANVEHKKIPKFYYLQFFLIEKRSSKQSVFQSNEVRKSYVHK